MSCFLFSAIQFVLSADEFSNLRQEERQALLHVSHFMSWYWDVNLYFFCYGSPGSNLLHLHTWKNPSVSCLCDEKIDRSTAAMSVVLSILCEN